MNDNEREMDLALAEAEQENRLLRARNERLERELAGQVALNKMAINALDIGLDYEPVAFVSGYHGGKCIIQPLEPSRVFNVGTALHTAKKKANT
jgi:hypothetical protein